MAIISGAPSGEDHHQQQDQKAPASESTPPSPPPPQPQDWSHLPDLVLLSIVLLLSSIPDFFSFAAVCRHWRAFLRSSAAVSRLLTSRYLSSRPPLLLLPHFPADGTAAGYRFQSIDLPDADEISLKSLLSPPSLRYIGLGYSHGRLILQRLPSNPHINLLLADPFTGHELLLPPPPPDRFPAIYYTAALTAPPSDPASILIVLTLKNLAYLRLSSSEWSTFTFPESTHVSSIIPFGNNVVYAVQSDSNTLIRFSDAGKDLSVVTHDDLHRNAVGGRPSFVSLDSYHYGPQLAECDGELIMVLMRMPAHAKGPKWIDCYRMDFEEMRWVYTRGFPDHALFMDACGRCPVFCSKPEQWGGRGNCVYITGQGWKTWREFDLDDGMMIPERGTLPLLFSEVTVPRWPSPIWVYPSMFF